MLLRVPVGAAAVAPPTALLEPNPRPALDLNGACAPLRIDHRLLTYFPRAERPGLPMLDLGCGSTHHRAVCELTGFEYVGVDIDESMSAATLLADGRALPFRDATVGFVLSIATLEHVPQPQLMLNEFNRVLLPGGTLIGTVAFLEPFHGNSYFHHSHRAIGAGLADSGFKIELLAPVPGWSALDALARMSLFPHLPGTVSNAVVAPLKALHRAWWRVGAARVTANSTRLYRELSTAGAFAFVARKPAV